MIPETSSRQALGLWDDFRRVDPSKSAGDPRRFTPSQLSGTRAEILTLHSEASLLDRPKLALAFMRLALMTELLDCLWAESTAIAVPLANFCEESFQKLHLDLGEDEEDELTDWILSKTTERWSEHLHLLDYIEKSDLDDRAYDEPSLSGEPSLSSNEAERSFESPQDSRIENSANAFSPPQTRGQVHSDRIQNAIPQPELEGFHDFEGVVPALKGNEFDPAIPAINGFAGFEIPDSPRRISIDPEFAETFLDEANDLFERIQGLVLTLDPDKNPRQPLLELSRCLHTLKGAAGSVGLEEFAGLIHSTEETIESASLKEFADHRLIDLMHKLLRYMEGMFHGIRSGPAPATSAAAHVESNTAIHRVSESSTIAAELEGPVIEGPVRISSERLDDLLDLVSELITRRGHWAAQAATLKEFSTLSKSCRSRLLATVDRIQDLRPTSAAARSAGGFQDHQSDLPELSRRLAEQADDLVVLTDSAQGFTKPLSDNSEALASLTLKIWESLQGLRIVPVKGLFQRLARVAHDAARVEGRRIEVIMTGEETGLDRAVQDKAFEPLLHIVRNAVAHGIESAAERRRAGKPDVGVVHLAAARTGNTMVLSVSDDGKGLDHHAIEKKARRLGLIAADETPDADRLNNLIFQPGFSTKDEANAISGRGVGMDVVTQEVSKIHGSVVLSSVEGEGTRVSLQLPARLSLEQAMLVRVDSQVFSLPVELVEAVDSFDRDAVEQRQSWPWIKVKETWAPLVSARDALGIESAIEASCPKILLVRVEGTPLAVLIDSIDGTSELVIKPLGPLVSGHPIISGTSQVVTGEVVLALNPSGLARWAQMEMGGRPLSDSKRLVDFERNALLVVDDSISVRKIVARQLRSLGYRVDEASDGVEALGKVRAYRYSMVVTDLEMPRMDGFELLSELSKHELTRAIPVLVTSTRTDDQTLRRIAELGGRGFIPKPIDPDELNLAVNKWLAEKSEPSSGLTVVAGQVGTIPAEVSEPSTAKRARGSPCSPL